LKALANLLLSYLIASYIAMGAGMAFSEGQAHPHSPEFLLWLVSPVWPFIFFDGLIKGQAGIYWTVFAVSFLASSIVIYKLQHRSKASARVEA
jgi:hypothetical protein